MTLNWQMVVCEQMQKTYQTDLYPLQKEDILVAVLPDLESLEKEIDEEQTKIFENIRTLLLTKLEDHTEEIAITENTGAVMFERTQVVSIFSKHKMRFSAWLNSHAPLQSKHKLAFFNTNFLAWEYMHEDLESLDQQELSVTFKLNVSVNATTFMSIVENWLRRQDVVHLCEVNEIFDMYLTNMNLSGVVASYEAEDVTENLIVQRKLQQKLNHSLGFFEDYGLNVEIQNIHWEAKEEQSKPETLTAKIEKNRKESPLDNTRYDRLQIGDIMDDNQFDRDLEMMVQKRSGKQDMISKITATRKIKK